MAQRFEDLHGEGNQRFYMQYFFPPFWVCEVGRVGSPGRREIGHGKLAERALTAILPSKDEFPYIIRLNQTSQNRTALHRWGCGGCGLDGSWRTDQTTSRWHRHGPSS